MFFRVILYDDRKNGTRDGARRRSKATTCRSEAKATRQVKRSRFYACKNNIRKKTKPERQIYLPDRFGVFQSDLFTMIVKMVPETGLEPVRLAAQDFKSRVSANSTTRAPLIFYNIYCIGEKINSLYCFFPFAA